MDTTIDALKNLYVACGGYEETVADLVLIPDMINALATLITGGAMNPLPEVDSEDNGKVLKVVEGEWAVGTDAVG